MVSNKTRNSIQIVPDVDKAVNKICYNNTSPCPNQSPTKTEDKVMKQRPKAVVWFNEVTKNDILW